MAESAGEYETILFERPRSALSRSLRPLRAAVSLDQGVHCRSGPSGDGVPYYAAEYGERQRVTAP
jgi:hypothetical protein